MNFIKNDHPHASGFLLIQKPVGITSHDVVERLRKITGIRTIGHSGTLDPFAEGLLIVGIGREATKRLGEFQKLDKTYIATLRLGAVSDTYDKTGNILSLVPSRQSTKNNRPRLSQIIHCLSSFTGAIEQIPPMYSAKKIHGKKLYELARQGKEIERKPHTVTIHSLEILHYDYPFLSIKVGCSSGTYIRSLGHDIGQRLGCGSYLLTLIRTDIGKYSLKDATKLQDLSRNCRVSTAFVAKFGYSLEKSLNKF
jgi:tRNA pseudouridine55 synthase